jgi:hypothetical protein
MITSNQILSKTYTRNTQKNDAVLKVNKEFTSHTTWTQHTISPAGSVQVSHALLAISFSSLLHSRGTSFQDGVAAGEGFLCAPF